MLGSFEKKGKVRESVAMDKTIPPGISFEKVAPHRLLWVGRGRVLAGEGAAKMVVFQMNFVKRKIFCCFVARGRDLGESTLGVHNLGSSSQTERTSSLVLVLGVSCST